MTEYHPLTPAQELGYAKFMAFYCDPTQTIMTLRGYSGTGKSTLIKTLLRDLPKMAEMCRTIAPDWIEPEPWLTATTNQAAEALFISVDRVLEARTIHSALGLRLHTPDYRKPDEKVLQPTQDPVVHKLIFIDEASFADKELVKLILQQTYRCKIVFVGDPAQLRPVGDDTEMPAFDMDACDIELTDLVRFAPGPMTDIVTNMRRAVLEQKWSKFPTVPGCLEKLDEKAFHKKALEYFSDPEQYGQVKILAYSNNRVIQFNKRFSEKLLGTSHPQPGQRMMVNQAIKNSASACYTNESVQIATVDEMEDYGFPGWEITLVGKSGYYFMPKSRGMITRAHNKANMEDNYQMMKLISDSWADLRPDFACTVNKSQGSTYDYVFIDLNDIVRYARNLDLLARQLYVAISRARKGVFFMGDLRRQ